MAKYEKKMIQFEAFRFNGDIVAPACDKDFDENEHAPAWAVTAVVNGILFFDSAKEGEPHCELYTRRPDGEVVHIPVGYYIIRWSDTELYPCEPNLFEASYILVAEDGEERCNLVIQDRHKLWEEKRPELEEAVKPLHEWLCKYGDPYVAVIVKQHGAQVFEGSISFELPVPD